MSVDMQGIRRHYEILSPQLNERARRLFAAGQLRALGHGGIAAVARATGIAPSTIGRGLRELDRGKRVATESGGPAVAANP